MKCAQCTKEFPDSRMIYDAVLERWICFDCDKLESAAVRADEGITRIRDRVIDHVTKENPPSLLPKEINELADRGSHIAAESGAKRRDHFKDIKGALDFAKSLLLGDEDEDG